MAQINRLTALSVKSLGIGKHADGGGLWLYKQSKETGQWVLRFTLHRKRREMGLGGINAVSLKTARELAAKWRECAKTGADPRRARDKESQEQARSDNTLGSVTQEAFEARKAELRERADDEFRGKCFAREKPLTPWRSEREAADAAPAPRVSAALGLRGGGRWLA